MNEFLRIGPSNFAGKGEKKIVNSMITGKPIYELNFSSDSQLAQEILLFREGWMKSRKSYSQHSVEIESKEMKKMLKSFLKNVPREQFEFFFIHETGASKMFADEQWKKVSSFISGIGSFEHPAQVKTAGGVLSWKPKGVILISLPSNETLESFVNSVFPALIMGNAVVVKPASGNAATAHILFSALRKCGVPEDRCLFAPINKEQTAMIIDNNLVNAIYWTGGAKSAAQVGANCLRTGVGFVYESEGNNWAYVASDADIKLAVSHIIRSLTENNGFMCNAIKGIFVDKSVAEKFMNELRVQLDEVSLGNPENKENSMGIIDKNSIDLMNKIIESANPAKIIAHPSAVNSHFPKVLVSPRNKNICYGEIFGPVAWVKIVKSEDEMLDEYSFNKHGIGFSLYSKSKILKDKCVDRISVARFDINSDALDVKMDEPWGGIRLSGEGGAKRWRDKFIDYVFIKQHK